MLYGAGWRQKLPEKNIVKEETDNYINNARLDPGWLGRETDLRILPDAVRRWVAQLASGGRAEDHPAASVVYMPRNGSEVIPAFGG